MNAKSLLLSFQRHETVDYAGAEIQAVIRGGRISETTNAAGVSVPVMRITIAAEDVPNPKVGDKVIVRESTYYVSAPPSAIGQREIFTIDLDKEVRRFTR